VPWQAPLIIAQTSYVYFILRPEYRVEKKPRKELHHLKFWWTV
jgi:hypothetical protein